MATYRNYTNSQFQQRVEKTYKKMFENQTINYVYQMKQKYLNPPYIKSNIWTMIKELDKINDESDPDNDLPQIIHAYQTGESIKSRYINKDCSFKNVDIKSIFSSEWDNLPEKYKIKFDTTFDNFYNNIGDWSWFPLVGFIHDLGKVMMLDDFGSLPQWSVVGDTFPVGAKMSSSVVFYDKMYYEKNSSLIENTYDLHCGFDNVLFSWGHDEYMASVLERNCTHFPKEVFYIIRYHSFYPWHSPRNGIRGYTHLANDYDWKMLPLLKAFQKADLYSKTREIPNVDKVRDTYEELILKYFHTHELLW